MEKILLIDDPGALARLAQPLAASGFQVEAGSPDEASIQLVFSANYTALLLATGLAGLSAFDLLRLVRASSRLPVLLLVESAHEAEGILGLELGADDYLVKPINPRALVARLRALLRRVRHAATSPLPPPLLTRGALELDVQQRTAWRSGEPLRLTAIEFDLLRTLLEAPGQLLARETLVETVFGRPYHPDDRSLDVHISKLRKKLEPAGWIRAVRGVGYVFTVEDNHVTLTNH
jgi:two-component system, OmpR family, response regulator CpxR